MFRRSIIRLSASKGGGRTIVRDPRKNKKSSRSLPAVQAQRGEETQVNSQFHKPMTPPLPLAPHSAGDGGVGSTLGSYVLAGVGMTLGFTVVKLVLGV